MILIILFQHIEDDNLEDILYLLHFLPLVHHPHKPSIKMSLNETKQRESLIYNNPAAATKNPWLGGPDTKLPFFVESCLSWSVALSCLSVSAYQYVLTIIVRPSMTWLRSQFIPMIRAPTSDVNSTHEENACANDFSASLPCWLPLTTCSRNEMDRCTQKERYNQLISHLKFLTATSPKEDMPPSGSLICSDGKLIELIRSNLTARRLATLFMRPGQSDDSDRDDQQKGLDKTGMVSMTIQLIRIWSSLLKLPPIVTNESSYRYEISLILPAFREHGSDIVTNMLKSFDSCRHPERVQVVIVDAGGCTDLVEASKKLGDGWGEVKLVTFTDGGGRGPCLNYGASMSDGRIYAFCHSDATLPDDWDVKIKDALCNMRDGGMTRANCCAFSFGIDTSEVALNGGPYPPGVRAVEAIVNTRTYLFSLPYGDQVLSLPASVFNYIGGFPDQCMMEDYDFVSLLRKRVALLPKFGGKDCREKLVIFRDDTVLCSPRRWQKFGVIYVTFTNHKLVHMYSGGMTPDDLFSRYYGASPPKRTSILSPWENEMVDLLHKQKS